MSLATKYRPKDFKSVVEQSTIVNIVSKLCEQEDLENRNFLFIGPAGTGKAERLTNKILTTSGFKLMKDIQIGDEVFTGSGNRGHVTGIYPQGKRPIYRITLQDRTYIEVSDQHLNVFYRYNEDSKCRQDYCMTTVDLFDFFKRSRFKLRIDIPSVNWEYSHVPIDPYLLGLLLGDGSISSNHPLQFTNSEADILDKVNSILIRDFKCILRHYEGPDHTIICDPSDLSGHGVLKLRSALASIDAAYPCKEKRIPKEYLYNSYQVRVAVLQGLFDTDGYIDSCGNVIFTTCSNQLSEDFAFLVRSLGIRDTCVSYPAKYKKNGEWIYTGATAHDHNLKIPENLEFCTSAKHCSRRKIRQNPPMRNIVSIDYVGEDECQCIMIDHPDHTYISSDGFIPTHNTTTARIMANVLNEGKDNTIEIDAASHNGVDSVREIINQARLYPVGSKYKVFVIDECFPGKTKVSALLGDVPIKDINVGDKVWVRSGVRKVLHKFINQVPTSRLIRLQITNSFDIVTTLDHKFFTENGWIEAQYLTSGTRLFHIDDRHQIYCDPLNNYQVWSSETYVPGVNDSAFLSCFTQDELNSGVVTMYDLEVEDEHCYFVNNILVHNCHSFSPQAWQIFLKPLEDAPAKSIFIFCTTNPEKIPATIISRVQTFQLSKISLKGIYNRLCYIIDQENKEGAGITYTEDAVNFIAKLANGGMRDSLTNLDKVLAFTHDLTSESVAKALNLPEYDDYFKLLGAYSKKDNQIVSQVINDVYNSGVNFVKWFEGFHSFVMNVVKYIFLQDINLTMIPSHYQEKISKYGTAHSIVCLRLANKLLKLNYELKTTQYLQEVALTYLCQLPKKEG